MGALRGDPSASHILFADAFDIAAAGVCAVKPPSNTPRFSALLGYALVVDRVGVGKERSSGSAKRARPPLRPYCTNCTVFSRHGAIERVRASSATPARRHPRA